MNLCLFIGNLTRDVELRSTPSGQSVANFTLACTRRWKDRNGTKQEKTEFIDCVAWGKTADIAAQYLAKGKQTSVQTRHERQEWNDKNTGEKRYRVHYVVEHLELIGNRGDAGGRMAAPGEAPASYDDQDFGGPGPGDEDDIPF